MLLRRPTGRQVKGASPARAARPMDQSRLIRLATQQPMLGLQAIQRMFLPSDVGVLFDYSGIANLTEDSAATTPAAVGSPIGRHADLSGKGNHALQATGANKPTLRTTPQTGRYWLEAIDSARALNITFGVAPGTMYVGRVTSEGMEWLTESWSTTTINILRTNRYNAGLVARSRDWSPAEKALISAYFSRQMPTLSAEKLANPTFAGNATGWTAYNAGLAFDGSDDLVVTGDTVGPAGVSQSGLSTSGKLVLLSVEASGAVGGATADRLFFSLASAITGGVSTGSPAYTIGVNTWVVNAAMSKLSVAVIAGSGHDTLRIRTNSTSTGAPFTIRSASVREVI